VVGATLSEGFLVGL